MSPPMQGRQAVVAIDYARDWPFALEARANFGPWSTNSDGTNGLTKTRWNSSGVLESVAQFSKAITYDPVTLECRGLVVEAVAATDLSGSGALNAAVSSAQNVTVTAAAHIVSFTGTGSITMSGAATGTITGTGADRPALQLVTTTAGTLTLTPSGQVRNLDVVQTPRHGQPIVAGTARSTESYQIGGAGFTAWWPGSTGWLYFEWWDKSSSLVESNELFCANFNNSFSQSVGAYYNTGTGQMNLWIYAGAVRTVTTTNVRIARAKNKLLIGWSPATGVYLVMNGGSAAALSAADLSPHGWPTPNALRMGNTIFSGASCMADVARVTTGTDYRTPAQAQVMTA